MTEGIRDADQEAITALLRAQFASLAWGDGREADWRGFASGFLPGAPLYPAARPVAPSTVDAFVRRMQGLAATTLSSFSERPLGIQVLGFGNVAVALAGCEMRENDRHTTRDVNAVLLVRSAGEWRIAAQAWDAVPAGSPPADPRSTVRPTNERRLS